MAGIDLSRISKIPPNPWHTTHTNGSQTPYTCHAAALHWAYMDQGRSQAEANAKVTDFTRATCSGCGTNGAMHASLPAQRYGFIFCSNAVRITRADLPNLAPGDLLITGHPAMPNHSMIVRQVNGPGHVTVRGFNNIGTLGTGTLLQYDPQSHNITQDKYWQTANMFGVNPGGIELWRVPYASFAQQVALSLNMRY